MKILYDNKVLSSAITRSSEHVRYPISLALLDPRLSRVGRTSGNTNEWIAFNLSAAVYVEYFVILNHAFSQTANVTLQGNSTGDFSAPAYSVTLTIEPEIIKKVEQTFQFWRIRATDATKSYIQVGYVYLGGSFTAPGMEQAQVFPAKTKSEYVKSDTMQIYGNRKTRFRAAEIQFPFLTNAQRKNFLTMFGYTDIILPFIILFWENSLDVEPPLYCNFTQELIFKRVQSSSADWSLQIEIEECK